MIWRYPGSDIQELGGVGFELLKPWPYRRNRPMNIDITREMVLQTTVAVLSLGLALLSLMLMGRWV
jgi:hypothetical protein